MPPVLGYVTPVRAYVNAGEILYAGGIWPGGRIRSPTHFEKLLICTRVVYGPLRRRRLRPLEAPNLRTDSPAISGHYAWLSAPFLRDIPRPTCDVPAKSDLGLYKGNVPYIAVLFLCAFAFSGPSALDCRESSGSAAD